MSEKNASPTPEDEEVLVKKYPDIAHWRNGHWAFAPEHARGRAACIEFTASSVVSIEQYQEAVALRKYFEVSVPRGTSLEPRRRLFLLEGINNDLRDVFASELDVDPNIWARHSWCQPWDTVWDSRRSVGTKYGLPSLYDGNQTFHINYSQATYLNLKEQDHELRCAENGRQIASSRVDGKFDDVGVILRKLSFWSRVRRNDGWDALLVVDAPFRYAVLQRNGEHAISPEKCAPQPFQGGYPDFIKFESTKAALSSGAPPRSSMFDDLLFYHSMHASYLRLTRDAKSATVFAQKIVASELVHVLHYHRCLLVTLASKLARRDRFQIFDSDWIEQAWGDLSSLQRRLDLKCRSIRRAIDEIGISRCHDGQSQGSSVARYPWMETSPDFLYIEAELMVLRQVAERLLGSFDSLAGLVGTRQSLHEARSVATLTRLGMIFLPLTLIAGLFSMSDHFQPGGKQFWMFFAVSVPSVILTFAMAWLFTRGRKLVDALMRRSSRSEEVPEESMVVGHHWA